MSGALAFLALILLIGIVVYLVVKLIKKEKVKKGVFIAIGVLIVTILVLGTIEGNKDKTIEGDTSNTFDESREKDNEEEEDQVESDTEDTQTEKSDFKETYSSASEDEKEKLKIVESTLKENFAGKADIILDTDTKEVKIIPIGEMAEGMLPLVNSRDNPEVREAWGSMKESFRLASQSVYNNVAKGVVMHMVNPYNKENTLLTVVDGLVVYDVLDN